MFALAIFAQLVGCTLLGQVASDQSGIQGSQLKYAGSFDIPMHGTWEEPLNRRFDYSMGIMSYREDRDALYLVTHAQDPTNVGLIKIPEKLSPSTIPIGVVLEQPVHLPSIPDREARLRGLYWDQPSQTLYYNYTVWYNVSGKDAAGFGAIRNGKPYGLWYVDHNNASAGYITRDSVSGQLVMGNAIAQGIATSSLGPSVFRLQWDEHKFPVAGARIPMQQLLFYPHGKLTPDPTRYARASSGTPWWHGMEVAGGVCVDRTLIFAVDEGEGCFYGSAAEFSEKFGFDSRNDYQGYHNDHYQAMLWFYSLSELDSGSRRGLASKQTQPREYYRIAEIPAGGWLGGLAYDATHRRIFVSQSRANAKMTPRIHVYQIDNLRSVDITGQ
jgi:hypothetical protein